MLSPIDTDGIYKDNPYKAAGLWATVDIANTIYWTRITGSRYSHRYLSTFPANCSGGQHHNPPHGKHYK